MINTDKLVFSRWSPCLSHLFCNEGICGFIGLNTMNALNQHCTQKQCNKKSVQNCKSNMTDSEQATQRERLSSAVLPQSELTKRAVKRKKRNRKKKRIGSTIQEKWLPRRQHDNWHDKTNVKTEILNQLTVGCLYKKGPLQCLWGVNFAPGIDKWLFLSFRKLFF